MDTPKELQLNERDVSKASPVKEDPREKAYQLESAIRCAVEWANLGGD
jgi:hypothetical protein